MKRVNALKARIRFGTILDEVSRRKEHFLIERLSKPMAVMIPVEEYEEKKKKETSRAERISKNTEDMEAWRNENAYRSLGADSGKLTRRMRDERTRHQVKLMNE